MGAAALMVWLGVDYLRIWSWPVHAVYWGFFLLILIAAMYIVLIDIRYIRLQYKLEQREIFQSTLADEEFRKALRAAQEAEAAEESSQRDS
jgi:predicted Holliday junction resolvase-like endonuclease